MAVRFEAGDSQVAARRLNWRMIAGWGKPGMSKDQQGAKRYPNLFLVGGPKCGTTSMVHYLGQHPDIFQPPSKEPHFFCSDFIRPRRYRRSEEDYLDLYKGWNNELYALDASTGYLFSNAAPKEILECEPNAHVIVMIRNPIEAAHAMYFENRYLGVESARRFEEALAREESRASTRARPKKQYLERLLYTRIYRYSDHIARYVDLFGQEKMHLIVFDDFKKDSRAEFIKLIEALNLNAGCAEMIDFSIKNAAKQPVFAPVSRWAGSPPAWVGRVTRPFLSRRQISRVRDFVRNATVARVSRPPMEPDTRRALADTFAPEVERLSEMLGRDLSHWVRGDG